MDYKLFGAIGGDISGVYYEGAHTRTKEYDEVRLIKTESSFSDDTVCTIAIATALLHYGNPTAEQFGEFLQKWCMKYPDRGYGKMFREWIKNPVPYGSYGNGSAMRVSPVGFFAETKSQCLELAKASAECSHNDEEGIKGAQAIALAVYLAKARYSKDVIKDTVLSYYPEYMEKTLDDIRPSYRFDSTCQGSVPIAILAFLESEDYEDCLKLAISMGGDSDTIAAMAGGIAYAHYGKMSSPMFDKIWDTLPDDMIDIVEAFDDICL